MLQPLSQPSSSLPRVLILGGGAAGCAVAAFLADAGMAVALAEKTGSLGGKARQYGCKATEECQNCGVCLLGGLFEKVENHPLIEVMAESELEELGGEAPNFTARVRTPLGPRVFPRLAAVVVATGFEEISTAMTAHLQVENLAAAPDCLLTSSQLETRINHRGLHTLLDAPPSSVAFLGCFGGEGFYCSRVCCAYTVRAARLLRQYYPGCQIAYYYTEMQDTAGGDRLSELAEAGVELVPCRPLTIEAGHPARLCCEDENGLAETREFDLIVLSEGIHPPAENAQIAKMTGLTLSKNGFLNTSARGLYSVGCARMPMRIEEVWADAGRVSTEILACLSGRAEADS